jgi:hypothetical protein
MFARRMRRIGQHVNCLLVPLILAVGVALWMVTTGYGQKQWPPTPDPYAPQFAHQHSVQMSPPSYGYHRADLSTTTSSTRASARYN